MKIAYFTTTFPALSVTFVMNQITGLIDRGHEVTIYSRRPGDGKPHPDVTKYQLDDRTRYARVLSVNPFARFIDVCGLLAGPYQKHGGIRAAMRAMNIARFGYRAMSGELLFAAAPFLDSPTHDVFHAHFAPNGVTLAMLKDAGLIHGKVITTFHDYGLSWYLKKWGPHVYDHLFEHGDRILAISHYARNRLIELGCPPDRVFVHRMGVDCARFSPAHRSRRNEDVVRLLSVCRLTEKKGIEYAIRAVANVADEMGGSRKLQYTIIGDGPLFDSLRALTKQLDAEGTIHFMGSKTQDEVAAALHESDLLLAPSVTAVDGDVEGIPVVLMEAMAAGVPVISTRHAAIPELVEDQKTGLLVEERDVDALVECIKLLCKDDAQRNSLGKNARDFVVQEFNIDVLNDRLVEHFEAVKMQ